MEDAAAVAPEARNSLNGHREQVFLLSLSNPDLSGEEKLWFILASFFFNGGLKKKRELKSLRDPGSSDLCSRS